MIIKHLIILQKPAGAANAQTIVKNHTIATWLLYSTCWYENIIYSALQWGEKHHPEISGYPKGLFYCAFTGLAFFSPPWRERTEDWKERWSKTSKCVAWPQGLGAASLCSCTAALHRHSLLLSGLTMAVRPCNTMQSYRVDRHPFPHLES